MTLLTDALGVGLTFTLAAGTPCPAPRLEVALQAGGVVVVRSPVTGRDEKARHTQHPLHTPGSRLVASTSTASSTSGDFTIAVCDLDHVKDGVSDRIIAERIQPATRLVYVNGGPMMAYVIGSHRGNTSSTK